MWDGRATASWQEIRNYIFSNYNVANDSGSMLTMVFDTGLGRSQMVMVGFIDADPSLVTFFSGFADAGSVDPKRVFEAAHGMPFGIVSTGDFYGFRHVAVADTIDGPEIDMPLVLLTSFADEVEKTLGLGDAF